MLHRLPLTRRLTLLFTLVVAGVVLGLGGLFMAAAHRHFIELDRAALHDKQRLIEDLFASADSAEAVRERLPQALGHHHGLFVRVADARGRTLYQTEGFPPPEQRLTAERETLAHALSGWGHGAPSYRAQRFGVTPRDASGAPLEVTLAVDTAHHRQFMDELLRTLAWYALGAILVSGVLGWLAVYYGLAPLRAIRAHAAQVTAQRLQARMPVQSVPVEMADLAQTLNQMLERLQDDFRRLSEFSSDLAHELRTPISNLLTQTQVTLSAPRSDEVYRDTLASNAEELQRLARMVADMLLLAKTEHGVDLPHREHFLAAPEVRALLDFYEAVAEDKSIALTLQGDGGIDGDRLMFRRALANLLSNALRHAPAGGAVRVSVAEGPDGTEIAVENNGPEIDPRVLPRLFDRFYRADPARAQRDGSDGAGLGLAITAAIVTAHGGQAAVSSSGGITRFALRFPHPRPGRAASV
jgi:two-component system heavy metal sensor histidine kinase CusS